MINGARELPGNSAKGSDANLLGEVTGLAKLLMELDIELFVTRLMEAQHRGW